MTKQICLVCRKNEAIELDGSKEWCESCRQYAYDMVHDFDEPDTIDDEWEDA